MDNNFKDEDSIHVLSDSELFELFENISNEESIIIQNDSDEIDEIDF